MNTNDATKNRLPRRVALAAGALVCAAGAAFLAGCGGETEAAYDYTQIPTVPVRRGDMVVKVTKGGSLQAMDSLIIKCELNGRAQITELISEGTILTQEDVQQGRILVQLDVSQLEEQETNQAISFRKAEASLRQAEEDLEIQKKDNTSSVESARLTAKFAKMELEKYVGSDLAAKMLAHEGDVNFKTLADSEELRGQARQELRQKNADVTLAEEERDRAIKTRDDTAKLEKEGYVSRNELETDELTVKRREIELERAIEERRLFQVYTLPKEAEKRLSDYDQAVLDVDKAESRARSQLSQKEAEFEARKVTYEREKERLEETRADIAKGVIKATQPGLVVYSSTTDHWRQRSGNMVEVGAEVWHGLPILEIPNLNTLAARLDIHETDISKVQIGQPAEISLDALPGKYFVGKVARKAPMAKSQSWRDEDVRVYETDVAFDMDELPPGVAVSDMNPGMSTTAEIIVAELFDVLYIPVQAVSTYKGDRVCWVQKETAPELRVIETGQFTTAYVEVKSGLQEGERVYMAPAGELKEDKDENGGKPEGRRNGNGKPQDGQQKTENTQAGETRTEDAGAGEQPADGERPASGERRSGRRREGGSGGRQSGSGESSN